MPRKQRFKPSRKQPPQPAPQRTQVEPVERREIHPDDVDVESEVPARGQPAVLDSDVEGGAGR
jgi:hypothetical protein